MYFSFLVFLLPLSAAFARATLFDRGQALSPPWKNASERQTSWDYWAKKEEAMTVADLICILRTHDQNAQVVMWDRDASGTPALSKLGRGEVQPVELFSEEELGSTWFELAADNPDSDGVRLPGVVLGAP